MRRRCRPSAWASGTCPILLHSTRFGMPLRLIAAADETGIRPEQSLDEAAEGHETLALPRQPDLSVRRDDDIAGRALFVDSPLHRTHVDDIAIDKRLLQFGCGHTRLLPLLERR